MSKEKTSISVRAAVAEDAPAMSAILKEIVIISGRDRACDPDHIRAFYVEHPDQISCLLACSETGQVLGFQSLKRAVAGNPYDVTTGWGVIGTYAKPSNGRRGIGKALFAATAQMAREHGVAKIDATINQTSAGAISYYEAMGFQTYRHTENAVCKCYTVEKSST